MIVPRVRVRGWSCRLSAVTERGAVAGCSVGELFGAEVMAKAAAAGADEFGEQGEFHTVAQVWEVSRERALGVDL